jgi:hypothetical protein
VVFRFAKTEKTSITNPFQTWNAEQFNRNLSPFSLLYFTVDTANMLDFSKFIDFYLTFQTLNTHYQYSDFALQCFKGKGFLFLMQSSINIYKLTGHSNFQNYILSKITCEFWVFYQTIFPWVQLKWLTNRWSR